jgi:hypothetical protein
MDKKLKLVSKNQNKKRKKLIGKRKKAGATVKIEGKRLRLYRKIMKKLNLTKMTDGGERKIKKYEAWRGMEAEIGTDRETNKRKDRYRDSDSDNDKNKKSREKKGKKERKGKEKGKRKKIAKDKN